jgi:hypothetical protein
MKLTQFKSGQLVQAHTILVYKIINHIAKTKLNKSYTIIENINGKYKQKIKASDEDNFWEVEAIRIKK